MSCTTHQNEIDKDVVRRRIEEQVRGFSGLRCPFCGIADLFVHPPGTIHCTGLRTWWTIGCDSSKCNSCWTLDVDTYDVAMEKIQHAQNPNPTHDA